MNTATHHLDLSLEPKALFNVSNASGVQILCRSGSLWVTLDGDLNDIVLDAGRPIHRHRAPARPDLRPGAGLAEPVHGAGCTPRAPDLACPARPRTPGELSAAARLSRCWPCLAPHHRPAGVQVGLVVLVLPGGAAAVALVAGDGDGVGAALLLAVATLNQFGMGPGRGASCAGCQRRSRTTPSSSIRSVEPVPCSWWGPQGCGRGGQFDHQALRRHGHCARAAGPGCRPAPGRGGEPGRARPSRSACCASVGPSPANKVDAWAGRPSSCSARTSSSVARTVWSEGSKRRAKSTSMLPL
jgi:hypothetical protein